MRTPRSPFPGPILTAILALVGFLASPAAADTTAELAPYDGFLVTHVTITGFDITKEYVIRREIRIQPGDTFRAQAVAADLTRLENLGIFSSQRVAAVAADSTVALTYTVREMPWIVPFPIVSYTEQDGFSFGAGVASLNMFGRAIIAGGSGTLGGVDTFSLAFVYPWITGNHFSIAAVLSDLTRDDSLNDFREHSREITPWFGRWIGDTGRVAATLSWFQMNADRDSVTISPGRRDDYVRFGIQLGIDTRDTWRNPKRGWNNQLMFMWYDATVMGGSGSWPLYQLDLRRYQPFAGRKNCVLIGGLLTYQDGVAGGEIPDYLQYRMGGANSVRGYDIETLGRELVGRNQLIVTIEYQRELVPLREFHVFKWAISAGLEAAAFFDMGGAWNTASEFNDDHTRRGGGAGLRFLFPGVYELRTDVAIGEGGDVYFHLGVGDKFSAQRERLR
ncbi:MAG TPA: BamA/TamA family outer membrane protein [Candidatus Krumholzibacteria bacterium]|nr:BamA/TamA family outer membrane protein [Candidatus Krumholzibacteria bacterium]